MKSWLMMLQIQLCRHMNNFFYKYVNIYLKRILFILKFINS